MSSTDLWDRLLPVATLIIGAGISQLGQRPARRRAAAHLLAGMKRQVWSGGEQGAWLDFQEYLGTLWVELRMAGVPRQLAGRLEAVAEQFWTAVQDSGDREATARNSEISVELDQLRGDVYDWLDSPFRPLRRYRIWLRTRAGASERPATSV